MEKPHNTKSLEERFKLFLESRYQAQNIDQMDIRKECQHLKRADYILCENIIVELKTISSDPAYKIEKKLAKHKDRKEYPVFYWPVSVDEILKYLPDKDKINKEILFSITKSIQHSFEHADKQVRDTKTIIEDENASGVLVLLNEDIKALDPRNITYIIRYMMSKKDEEGSLRYQNIQYVYLISEAHFQRGENNMICLPVVIIDGPLSKEFPQTAKKLQECNHEWAAFNGNSLLEVSGSSLEALNKGFQTFDDDTKEVHASEMQRHELWRKEYRENPYLNKLNETEFKSYGENVIYELAPHFLKNSPKKPSKETLELMIKWTHFLEEAELRNFNMKQIKFDANKI